MKEIKVHFKNNLCQLNRNMYLKSKRIWNTENNGSKYFENFAQKFEKVWSGHLAPLPAPQCSMSTLILRNCAAESTLLRLNEGDASLLYNSTATNFYRLLNLARQLRRLNWPQLASIVTLKFYPLQKLTPRAQWWDWLRSLRTICIENRNKCPLLWSCFSPRPIMIRLP